MYENHTTYQYRLVSRWQTSPDAQRYLGYGICVVQNTSRGEGILSVIWDISDRKSLVSELVENCNRLRLEPIHFVNVVEDALISQGNGFRNF